MVSILRGVIAANRSANRAGQSATRGLLAGFEQRQLEKPDRRTRKRGYLVAGDRPPPPGVDVLDYSGLTVGKPLGKLRDRDGVVLGGLVDPVGAKVCGPYLIPVERFFQHIAVVAPPGKGKTHGIIAPLAVRLVRAGVSVIALDAKGDLIDELRQFADDLPVRPQIKMFRWSTDPHNGPHNWNPLSGVHPDDLTAIEGLKVSILGSEPDDPKHRLFHDKELRVCGAVLRVLLREYPDPTLPDLLSLVLNRPHLDTLLRKPEHADANLELFEYMSAEPSKAAEMVSTLQNRLAPFVAAQTRHRTAASDFTIAEVLAEPTLLIAGAEMKLGQRGEIAAALLLNRVSAEFQSGFGRRAGVPVVILMDEAPVLAKRVDLSKLLATARGARVGVVLAAQNVTQFGDEDKRSQIFDACDTMVLLEGASDASIKTFQSRLGERSAQSTTLTNQAGVYAGSSTRSTHMVPVLAAREIAQTPWGSYSAMVHSKSDRIGPVAVDLGRAVSIDVDC